MKKKDIHKYRKSYLLFCIAISIICPCGIPFIPIGFVMGGPIWIAVAIVGIILTVFGFYGLPLFWSAFASVNRRSNVYAAITIDNLSSCTEIASQTNSNRDIVSKDVNWLLIKRYITGFLFDGEHLKVNEKAVEEMKKKEPRWSGTCPHCGGTKVIERNGKLYCEYCGADVTKD